MLCCIAFIVSDNVCCHALQSVIITQNDFKLAHCTAAAVSLFCVRAFFLTLCVIGLYLLRLFDVKHDPRKSGFIFERYGNAVGNSLLHCVPVNDGAENMHGFFNRRTSKSDECGVRQRIMQILCKAEFHKSPGVAVLAAVFDLKFFAEVELRAMRLIAETNNVAALRQKPCCLTELLHCRHKYAA